MTNREYLGWPADRAEERRLRNEVKRRGYYIMVMMADPPYWTYSAGLHASCGQPELMMFNEPSTLLAEDTVSALACRVLAGERFVAGQLVPGAVPGSHYRLLQVDRAHYSTYFEEAQRFYKGDGFAVLQLVRSDAQGRFPGDPKYNTRWSGLQPLLGRDAASPD